MSRTYTDKEIVAAIKAGQSDGALQFLYDTTQHKIRNYVINNSGSTAEAQDIFQDAVVAFFQHVLANKFDDSKSVDGFIYAITRNRWINRAKKLKTMVAGLEPGEHFATQADENEFLTRTIDSERAQKIDALLSQLGARCKALLTFSIFYKLPMEEIAQRMEYNGPDAAKTQNYKCKQKLIKLIQDNAGLKEWLYR